MKLLGYGTRNLRSLRDTGVVEFKPINILVGKNSAGKSSFARVAALLKQSAERRKQVPVLWFGRLVDFGSFGEALSASAASRNANTIDLLFRFSCPAALTYGRRYERDSRNSTPHRINVCVSLGSGDEGRTTLRQLTLELFDCKIEVLVKGSTYTFSIDGQTVNLPENTEIVLFQGAVIPQIFLRIPVANPGERVRTSLGIAEAVKILGSLVPEDKNRVRLEEIASQLPVTDLDNLLFHCIRLAGTTPEWRAKFSEIGPESQELRNLQRAVLMLNISNVLEELDEAMQAFANGVTYLEPLRATAQRYYRQEETSIDEIDPKGLNTAFFIQGLPQRERDSLNNWLSKELGFRLHVQQAGGHVSLAIQTAPNHTRNMADVGLGYSQLAPVALQVWAATDRRTRRRQFGRAPLGQTLVIEQPELHLHPALQSKLADVFVSASQRANSQEPTSFIIETHSPNLINRLGELVNEQLIEKELIQVILFEQTENSMDSELRISTFDEKGVLQNWPVGFFGY